jgi:hypothetical protein
MLSPNTPFNRYYRLGVAALALLACGAASAANVGPAATGTSLTDAGSDFTVLVTSATGTSFGTVTLINDALSFTPSAFTSNVVIGAGSGQLTGVITLLLTPTSADRLISATALKELGDYWLDNSGGTARMLGASYQLVARNASGNTNFSQVIQNTNSANTQGPSPLAVTGFGNNTAWGLAGSIAGGAAGGWAPTAGSAVVVTIQNNLYWNIGAGNAGFIQKKDAAMTLNVQASTVPLPASAWLLLPGVGLLASFARRRP